MNEIKKYKKNEMIYPIDVTGAVIDTAAKIIADAFAQLSCKPLYWKAIEDALLYEDFSTSSSEAIKSEWRLPPST